TEISPRQLFGGGGSGSGCKPVMVIFARGTTELGGMGQIAGPPFQMALNAKMAGQVSMQGVPAPAYPADVPGYLAGGSASGASKMAEMVKEAATNCPDAKIIMSGYSQGGQLVHKAAAQLDSQTAAKVAGAVIFGDPDNPKPVENVQNLKVFCAAGDLICAGQPVILAPHLSYGANAGAAADWVAQ
ncbi:cutinase, partial [Macrophomina phaseolina]